MDREKLMKLPKWAQDEIGKLEYKLRKAEETVEVMKGHAKSNTLVGPHSMSGQTFYLPDCTAVKFMGDNPFENVVVNRKFGENLIRVEIGDGLIIPVVRNVIHVVWEKK